MHTDLAQKERYGSAPNSILDVQTIDRPSQMCHDVCLEGERIRAWQALAFKELANRGPQTSAARMRRIFPLFIKSSPHDQHSWSIIDTTSLRGPLLGME